MSAGLLMYRRCATGVEVFLVHPGGPFWARKDAGAWTVPKGEYTDGEEPLAAAKREFEEETGWSPGGNYIALGEVRQAGGKLVSAWAFEGDCDPASLKSNTFSMEWPRGSGKMREFPEVDRGAWFSLAEARVRILPSQAEFLNRLISHVSA